MKQKMTSRYLNVRTTAGDNHTIAIVSVFGKTFRPPNDMALDELVQRAEQAHGFKVKRSWFSIRKCKTVKFCGYDTYLTSVECPAEENDMSIMTYEYGNHLEFAIDIFSISNDGDKPDATVCFGIDGTDDPDFVAGQVLEQWCEDHYLSSAWYHWEWTGGHASAILAAFK